MKFDIALKSGIWITGKVTDVATGKPVAAAVDYFPMLTNTHAKDYPNFDPNIMSIDIKTRYKTDAAGRFRIVGLARRGSGHRPHGRQVVPGRRRGANRSRAGRARTSC